MMPYIKSLEVGGRLSIYDLPEIVDTESNIFMICYVMKQDC